MTNANLVNADLSSGDLNHANLASANLTGATLTHTNLTFADLTGADLTGSSASNVAFDFSNLTNTVLTNADLSNAHLQHATLAGTTVTDAILTGADCFQMSSGGLIGVPTALPNGFTLRRGYLFGPYALLTGVDLSNFDLSNLDLDGAYLTGVNLAGADLSATTLTHVRSGGVLGSPMSLPADYRLVAGYLLGPAVSIESATLSGADLSAINLSGANLYAADLTGANVTGVNFSDAQLTAVILKNAKSTGANFTGANLSEATLSGANLIYSTFVGANLRDANLTGADLGQADLTGAVWSNTTCVDGSLSNRHVAGSCLQPLDSTAPSSAVGQLPSFSLGSSIPVTWSGLDGAGSGVKSFDVRYNRTPVSGGTASAWAAWKTATAATRATLSPTPGFKYCVQTRAKDNNNNVGAWSVSRCTNSPLDDRALVASAGWIRGTDASSFARTRSSTSKLGVTLTSARVASHQLGIIATACKTCGKVDVFIGTTKVGSISLYTPASTAVKKMFMLPRFKTVKAGPVKIITSD